MVERWTDVLPLQDKAGRFGPAFLFISFGNHQLQGQPGVIGVLNIDI